MRLLYLFTFALLAAGVYPVKADYLQNFDTGSASYTVGDPYWADTSIAACNGYIVQSNTGSGVCTGLFASYPITHDVGGSGYFLFTGTAGATTPSNNEFFISPSFSVTPSTQYTVSFYLTNANNLGLASLQPEIDGALPGSAVSANGYFSDGNPADGWQRFSFQWNSGANSTASLILHDLQTTTTGNDFGLDVISVSPTSAPEPSAFSMIGLGTLAFLGWSRRKRV